MATDYDAPRRGDVDELNEDSIEELKARRAEAQSGSIDVDETELAENLELPGADLSSMSGEELTVRVLPKQNDEFTCSSCFLVHHRSRLASEKNGVMICTDCAA
jgi:formylmethanofuran dehydrogenase subunit E